jgi:prepilin-type N-terminal cleavage/methylation domain-containing protein
MKNSSLQKGFTLIELLVVISIIGLLSSIVLPSLSETRKKAKNARVNQEVGQWLNAIELYRGDNGGDFPLESSPSTNACPGGPFPIVCTNAVADTNFKAAMGNYIDVSVNPNRDGLLSNWGFSFYSVYTYRSLEDRAEFWWYMDGDVDCIRDEDSRMYQGYGGDVTQCVIYIE